MEMGMPLKITLKGLKDIKNWLVFSRKHILVFIFFPSFFLSQ